MRCSVCGRDIPDIGDICLHCQNNKFKEQLYIGLVLILGLVFGCAGYLTLGFRGAIGGFIVSCIIAGFVSFICYDTE